MGECILGLRSVVYHPWVTVTLTTTYDLVSRISIESGAHISLLFFEVGIPNLVRGCI